MSVSRAMRIIAQRSLSYTLTEQFPNLGAMPEEYVGFRPRRNFFCEGVYRAFFIISLPS